MQKQHVAAGQKGKTEKGGKASKLVLVAVKVLDGLLEMLWIQPDVRSLAHYILTPEFAT